MSVADRLTINLKESITNGASSLFESSNISRTWYGKTVVFACRYTPLYIDPNVIQLIEKTEKQLELIRGWDGPIEAKGLEGKSLFRLAKGEAFEKVFPRRVETIDVLKRGENSEKLGHLNNYSATCYTYEEAKALFDQPPESYLLGKSEQEELTFYKKLLEVHQIASERGLFSKEQLTARLETELGDLFARNGMVPTFGSALSIGVGLVNPLAGTALSLTIAAYKAKHEFKHGDIFSIGYNLFNLVH